MDALGPFRGLDLNSTRVLEFETANHILATYSNNAASSTVVPSFLIKKNYLLHVLVVMFLEHFITEHVSPNSPSRTNLLSAVSVAGKGDEETISFPEQRHVNVWRKVLMKSESRCYYCCRSLFLVTSYGTTKENCIQRYGLTYREMHGAKKFCQSKTNIRKEIITKR